MNKSLEFFFCAAYVAPKLVSLQILSICLQKPQELRPIADLEDQQDAGIKYTCLSVGEGNAQSKQMLVNYELCSSCQ